MAEYLKIPEVAQRLDVSEKTARRMVKGGKLPSVFIGGAYRVSEEDLEKYLEAARVEPGDGSGKAQAPPPPEDTSEKRRAEVDPWTASWTAYIRRRAGRIQEVASNEASPEFANPQSAFGFVTRCNEEGGDMYETVVEDMPGDAEPFDPAMIDELVAALEDFGRAVGQAQARAWMLKAIAPEDAVAQKRAERSAEEAQRQRARLPERFANRA